MTDAARRIGPTQLTTTSAVIYTVPAATTMIVRNIHVNNTSAGSTTFSLALNAAAGTSANGIYTAYTVPPNTILDWSGFMVLNAADTLQALAGNATALTITISGVESA